MVVVGVLMVLVSLMYYLGVVKAMFVDRAEGDVRPMYVPAATVVASVVTGGGVLATTLLSGPLFDIAMSAARAFLTSGQVVAMLK